VAEIFAFDTSIQNPDRRYDKPNVLWRDEEMFVIDHELAFSLLHAIGAQGPTWEIKNATSLTAMCSTAS
jgi:hypothetical protein